MTEAGNPTAFVAYPSEPEALGQCIRDAISLVNDQQQAIRFETWEDNDISGRPLIAPILEKITKSSAVVADITKANPNVIYEIGFALGSRKRVYLINNRAIKNDYELFKKTGIFDSLGYKNYTDERSLAQLLSSRIDFEPIAIDYQKDLQKPLYILHTPIQGQVMGKITSAVKKARFGFRSFNPGEESRLAAISALEQAAMSYGIVIPWLADTDAEGEIHNVRAAFIAGLAHGMETPAIILQEYGTESPLDVRDFTKTYKFPEDIGAAIAEWIPEVNSEIQQASPIPQTATNLLQRIKMGSPQAENEFDTIGQYYVYTDQYQRALQGDVGVVVGRKGSGKTALWAQLRDRLRASKKNIVLDLKPEGYQLLKLREEVLDYLSEGAQAHLVIAFWEYLLLLEVTFKILEKDERPHLRDHELFEPYRKLKALYLEEEGIGEGDFSERLLRLSASISLKYRSEFGEQKDTRLTNAQITNLLYTHDIRNLRTEVSNYLQFKDSVWILFDNLDRGWSAKGLGDADYLILRCLIDAGRKLQNDMHRERHDFHCVVFIRDDVYQQLSAKSPDFGKDTRAALDWSDPDLLRELLRKRFVVNELPADADFYNLWRIIGVGHFHGEESSQYLIDRSLMRPRNLLKLFNYCRGAAINFNHERIEESDIEKGLEGYSGDLLYDADHELADMVPEAEGLIYLFEREKPIQRREDLEVLMEMRGIAPALYDTVVEFLIYYGMLGVVIDGGEPEYIYDLGYNMNRIKTLLAKSASNARFYLNPAFWHGLRVDG